MSKSSVNDIVNRILWNAWTELGVPGVERAQRRIAVDPDPLVVFTPALAVDDPRLLEQVSEWCERFGNVVVTTRLWGIAKDLPVEIAQAFESFVESVGGSASHWRRSKTALGRGPHSTRTPPLERPSLARIRMRSLAGTGARADVLCELLAAPRTAWMSATELERLGYARRSVARVLQELADAGIVVERPSGGPSAFRLRSADALAELVAARELRWPDWTALLTLAWHLVTLERSEGKHPSLFQLQVSEAQREVSRLARATGLHEPLSRIGEASWPYLRDWGASTLHSWLVNESSLAAV